MIPAVTVLKLSSSKFWAHFACPKRSKARGKVRFANLPSGFRADLLASRQEAVLGLTQGLNLQGLAQVMNF